MIEVPAFRLVTAFILIMTLSGCSSTKPPNYYALYSLQTTGAQTLAVDMGRDIAIGVGPVRIPEYLDRPHIATRPTTSTLQFAEFDKWAESLEKSLARVIAENLSVLVPSDHVYMFPWANCIPIRYQVSMDVLHLEKMPDGKVLLDAHWNILGKDGETLLVMKRSRVVMPVESAGFDGLAAAESRAVEALSLEIAAAIRSLPAEST